MTAMSVPSVSWTTSLEDPAIFCKTFGAKSDAEWEQILYASIDSDEIDGLSFPKYPDIETQRRIHGSSSTQHSLREASDFYKFVKSVTYRGDAVESRKLRMLDFGSGWGRIHRPFMKDIPVNNIFAFEPYYPFCVLSRSLNPYISILSGDFLPDGMLPKGVFDLVVGWSIFSHLSEMSAAAWLAELAAALKPGGRCVLTTWGMRFLERLKQEQTLLNRGQEIHWYSKVCIEACGGDLDLQITRYKNGEFVWFTSGASKLYGEAFLSRSFLERLLAGNTIALKIVGFDSAKLGQDVFVLEKGVI